MTIESVSWGAWTIVVPLIGAATTIVVGHRRAPAVGVVTTVVTVLAAAGAVVRLCLAGPERHAVGGWKAPLGIELTFDGPGLTFVALASVVSVCVAVFATRSPWNDEQRARFWPLFFILQAGLNALFVSGDLFNLYVTLEVVGIAAAGLTAMERNREALTAALRYLMLSLVGSFSYLVAVVLVYHEHGTLDLAALAQRTGDSVLAPTIVALTGAGLLLKSALFPLHSWLPPAHASAPAPVSALLSGLVVKAAYFVLLRLTTSIGPDVWGGPVAMVMGLLGSAAIVWGYAQALIAARLKTLIAYSTVAQIGQLFLVFPIAAAGSRGAVSAALLLNISHALAKSAAFLCAGNILHASGSGSVRDLAGIASRMPVTTTTLALVALSLVGLPPSAAFLGKWMLIEASVAQGQWMWPAVLVGATMLSGAAMFRILGNAMARPPEQLPPMARLPRAVHVVPLVLAILAAVLGVLGGPIVHLLQGQTGPGGGG